MESVLALDLVCRSLTSHAGHPTRHNLVAVRHGGREAGKFVLRPNTFENSLKRFCRRCGGRLEFGL
jgi:hypothetical protein